MISYHRPDTDEIVGVYHGLGNVWIAGVCKPSGATKRVKSAAMPPCNAREHCQANLDAYAAAKGWQPVERRDDGNSQT